MPDARAGEAVDDFDAQLLRRPGGVFHFFDCPRVDALRLAVAPDVRRQNRLVPAVDPVEHGLADRMGADGVHLQLVALQQIAAAGAIAVFGQRPVDVEMIAPAGQFQAVVAKVGRLAGQVFQRQIGPLAGKQRDRASHAKLPAASARIAAFAPHCAGSYGRSQRAAATALVAGRRNS